MVPKTTPNRQNQLKIEAECPLRFYLIFQRLFTQKKQDARKSLIFIVICKYSNIRPFALIFLSVPRLLQNSILAPEIRKNRFKSQSKIEFGSIFQKIFVRYWLHSGTLLGSIWTPKLFKMLRR